MGIGIAGDVGTSCNRGEIATGSNCNLIGFDHSLTSSPIQARTLMVCACHGNAL